MIAVEVKEDMTGWVMSEHGVADSKLTVLHRVDDYISPSGRKFARWKCKCSCGDDSYIVAIGSKIKHGEVKSCGCMSEASQFAVKMNRYNLSGEYGIGYCNNTGTEFYFDIEDFEKIKDYGWYEVKAADSKYKNVRTYDPKTGKKFHMSQIVMGNNYDHKNRNPFDNRKENLRIATKRENAINRTKQNNNTSGFIGVYWHKQRNKWTARIKVNGTEIHIGTFADKTDAIVARLNAELKYFGVQFAPQRHLFEEYGIITSNNCSNTKKG